MLRTSTRAHLLVVAAVAIAGGGCPRGGARGPAPAPAALTIPAASGAAERLADLATRARAGDVAAAWTRVHYLLDLFDDARFRGDATSRALLTQALGVTDARGAAATDASLDALRTEVDGVLAHDRLHAGASAARVLLEMDRHPPAHRAEVFQRMTELKAAGRVDQLAANAALRRSFYCYQALEDATRAPPALRTQRLSHCLYPLYDADPEPYFAADPTRRPPPPRWQDLISDAVALLGATDGSRLELAARHLAGELDDLAKKRGSELPVEPSPEKLGVPEADHAVVYDGQPLLTVDGDTDPERAASALSLQLEGDGRGELMLPLPADAPRSRFDVAVDTARRAGATAVDLGVMIAQTLEVPTGDYWAVHGGPTTVQRLAGVRVALGTDVQGDGAPTRGPLRRLWDPARARLGLRLVIDATHWRVVAPDGQVGAVKAVAEKGDPRTELRVLLARVQAAFPDERGLIVVTQPDASYASIARAIASAAYDDRGQPLFPHAGAGRRRAPGDVGDADGGRADRSPLARARPGRAGAAGQPGGGGAPLLPGAARGETGAGRQRAPDRQQHRQLARSSAAPPTPCEGP